MSELQPLCSIEKFSSTSLATAALVKCVVRVLTFLFLALDDRQNILPQEAIPTTADEYQKRAPPSFFDRQDSNLADRAADDRAESVSSLPTTTGGDLYLSMPRAK